MLTGEIRNQIDQIWKVFWSGGISNPLEVIEQITYLLFLKRLDEQETAEELKANSEKKPMQKRFFPEGKDSKKRSFQDYRWSHFKNTDPRDMYTMVSEHVFPWLRTLGGNGTTYSKHMEGARFTIPPGPLLAKVVDMIDKVPMEDRDTKGGEVAERLRQEVAQMNVNNFIVRPKRRLVEKYADATAWETLGVDERNELVGDVAGLPSELVDEDLEAKQFDLLMLRLQLGLLRHERSFTRWSEDVRQIAGALEEKASIPMVRAELELIIEVQTDEFWQDITAPMLEGVRKRLRSLVKFIEKTKRQNIYTDFADLIGEEREIDLPGFAAGHDVERFRDKTQQFLRAHENDPVIHKLRWNEPLSKYDLDALEKILVEAGAGTPDDLSKVRSGSGLGLFVREMIGLDREAAKRAFDGFLAGKTLTANQIQFVNLVVDYLTQSGWMRAAQLYESPFTDYSPRGVEGVFDSAQVAQLLSILDSIRQAAAAS